MKVIRPGKLPVRARTRALAALVLVLAAAAVVALIATNRSDGGNDPGDLSASEYTGTATVETRNLVTSENESGTISYARPQTVYNRLSGTITSLPRVGQVIAPGGTLFTVDNYPVILMSGATPAYRTLDSSDSAGPDIYQLNENLIELGDDPDGIVLDDAWQAATTAGVDAFQKAHGLTETGSLTLGTIVFLTGDQRIATIAGAVGSGAGYDPGAGQSEFADYSPATQTPTAPARTPRRTRTTTTPSATTAPTTTTTTTSATTTTGTTPAQGKTPSTGKGSAAAAAEIRRLKAQLQKALAAEQHHSDAPAGHDRKPSDDSGPATGGGSPIMTTTSTNLVVTVSVSAGDQSVTYVGQRVPVQMPDGSTIHGHVSKIGAASSGQGGSTVPITITLDKRENGRNLDQATVSVKFIESTAKHVLSVPITSLLARPGGGFAVQEAAAPHKLIPVKTGTFATGYVQISGTGISAGLQVTDSQG